MTEAEWLAYLNDVPFWQPPPSPLLVVAPHPDDEVLGAGGLISAARGAGVPVILAAVTDGEAAYPNAHEPGLGAHRAQEQTRAASRLGIPPEAIFRFGLPDSNVSSREAELEERLRALITPETLVLAPWDFDPHPDHEACARAAKRVSATRISYFFWTWHWRTSAALTGLSLRRFAVDDAGAHARAAALAEHRSQLFREQGAPILPESRLAPARRPFETFALHD